MRLESESQNITDLVSDVVQNLNPDIAKITSIDRVLFRHTGTTPFETYYAAGIQTSDTSLNNSSALGRGTIYAVPFLSARGGKVDRIACRVNSGATSGEFRMGIYQVTSAENLYPNQLIVDAGTFDASTSGVRTGTIDVTFLPNTVYYFTWVAGGTSSATYRVSLATYTVNLLGVGTAFTEANNAFRGAFTYDVFPATFPSGVGIFSGTVPAIGVRFIA